MATMNALAVEAVGKPLVSITRPVPKPAEGEILIKVGVVGLNPYDFRVRDWGLYIEGLIPYVLGNDIAGTVEEIGPNTTIDLKPGDQIFGQTNYLKRTSDQSGLQEYTLLDAYTVAKVPEGLTPDDGASLCCNIVAPFWAIFGADGLALPFPFPAEAAESSNSTSTPAFDFSKATIVIIGAGSNCGKYGIQTCSIAGFGTIVAVASTSKPGSTETLRSYGATHVIDRSGTTEEISTRIRSVVGDNLIYAFDAVNVDHTLGVSILSTTTKGTLACIVPGKADETQIGPTKKAGYDDKFTQGQSHNQPELGRKFWKAIPGWMAQGRVKSTGWSVIRGLDTEAVNQVLDDYRDDRWPDKQVHVHVS